jgi:hypothetical protein
MNAIYGIENPVAPFQGFIECPDWNPGRCPGLPCEAPSGTSCNVPRREEAGPKDLQLQTGVNFGTVDMGAYEFQTPGGSGEE